jgi:acyl-CoA hydrolase
MKVTQHFVVQPTDLNHMGSLFGGAACSQADLTGYICASLEYPDASFVTRHFEPFNFLAPAHLGDILAVTADIVETGNTSVVVNLEAINTKTKCRIYATKAVFVNVLNGQKSPLTK